MNPLAKLLLLFMGFAILSCSKEPVELHENTSTPIMLYLCPQHDCETALLRSLQAANNTIDCAFFDLDSQRIIDLLENKSSENRVRIVVDDTNKAGLENYSFIRFDTSSQYSHNKFCIIDARWMISGSANPTFNGLKRNRNNIVVFHSRILSESFMREFEELWAGQFGKGGPGAINVTLGGIFIENLFCPEDGCSRRLKMLISRAESSVYFLTFSFTDWSIANSLILANSRGVNVMGVFEKQQKSKYSQYERLKLQGLDVSWDSYPYKMHHKVFVIDEHTVFLGSYNPTKSGDTRNDENVLIIHSKELAEIFIKEYQDIQDLKLTN